MVTQAKTSSASARSTRGGASKRVSHGEGDERGRSSRGAARKLSGTSDSFASVDQAMTTRTRDSSQSFSGVSMSPPAYEPTPSTAGGGTVARKLSAGSSSSGNAASKTTTTTTDSDSLASDGEPKRRSSRRTHKAAERFGEFQSWETVAADEVPPSPAFVGNPRQRQAYLEAYAKAQYEEEIAARKAAGVSTDGAVEDVHSRVAELMKMADEMLPDAAPSPAKSLHAKSLREQLHESWQGKGYYARLMAQMASPSPARPNQRPMHMQRLHKAQNPPPVARAKAEEFERQQASLVNMSGAALSGAGGYLFSNLPGMAPPAAVAPKVQEAVKSKRKSGDVMPPPGVPKRSGADSSSSPEPTNSEVTIESVTKTIQKALRRLSMSPAPRMMGARAVDSSSSPELVGTQLKFGSPSDSSSKPTDVDEALASDDITIVRRALRELRHENEKLRAELADTKKKAKIAVARAAEIAKW